VKYLIGLGAIGLLTISGCTKNSGREHFIVCVDPSNLNITTKIAITSGNVAAFVLKGHSVLSYKRKATDKREIIFLDENDCVIY
jgi:hypothetical protein